MTDDLSFDYDGTLDTQVHGSSLKALSGIRDSDLPAHAKLVASMLISRARPVHEEGWICWPSLNRLTRDTGLSKSSIQRALRALRTAGLVSWTVEEHWTTSNRYRLDYGAMEALRGG
jgi:hypothetical protein